MTKRSIIHIFSNLFLVFLITSCNTDDSVDYEYPTDVILSIGTNYLYTLESSSDNWLVTTSNDDVVDALIESNTLFLLPKKVGKSVAVVIDSTMKTIFTCKIEVIAGKTEFRIDSLYSIIEISNAQYRELINNEVDSLFPFPISTIYSFTYSSQNEGDLSISPYPNVNDSIKGSFYIGEKDSVCLIYNDHVHNYISEYKVVKEENEKLCVDKYLIQDYTQYFREKYPQANVSDIKCYQIMNWLY